MVGGVASLKPLGENSHQEIQVRVDAIVWSLKSTDEANRPEIQTQTHIEALS